MDEQFNRIINASNTFLARERHYGDGVSATPAEAHLVESIHHHPDANSNELAQLLGFTKGNLSVRAAKLCAKGLVEKYNRDGNRKEIHYRVTARGLHLYHAHARFHADQNRPVYQKYLSFSEQEKALLCGFLKEYADYLANYFMRRA